MPVALAVLLFVGVQENTSCSQIMRRLEIRVNLSADYADYADFFGLAFNLMSVPYDIHHSLKI
jgi:hypothetical protein